jgi:citrate lyase synthetase
MTRYRLDPIFDRTPDGAVKGIIRYDIYLDGRFVGSRRTHAVCHQYLDELMRVIPEPTPVTPTIQALRRRAEQQALMSASVIEFILPAAKRNCA